MATSNKRISLNTIAEHLGLSTSTVSRALADHAGISEATKARVRQLAEELNYLPNHLAASLRKGRSNTLGVIVPHINGYFFPAVMNGIEKVASQAGFNVMMCQSNEDVRRERQNIATLLAAQVEGIILSLSATTHQQVGHFEQAQQQGTPLVFFDRMPELPNSTAVVLDDFKGAYQAVTHLIEQGCTRIAHLAGPQQLNTSRNRFLGYQEALRAHGLPLLDELVYQLPSSKLEDGRAGMAQLLTLPTPPRWRVCGVCLFGRGRPRSAAPEELTRAARRGAGVLQQRALHDHDPAQPDGRRPARRPNGRNCRALAAPIAEAGPGLHAAPYCAQA